MTRSMDKAEYFLRAIGAESYREKAWVIECFSRVANLRGEGKHYAYALTRREDNSYSFHDPETKEEIILEGTFLQGAPFQFMEDLAVKPGDLPNIKERLATCYGNVLVNAVALVYAFGDKIPFQAGPLQVSKIERLIEQRLQDTPPPSQPRDPKYLYVDEFKKFNEAIRYLEGFTQLCVPSATRKTITVSKDVIKRRNELLKEYAGQLEDPVIQARINRELTQMERDWMKGDPAERFYIKAKSYDVVRQRLFLMQGQENGFGKTGEVITTSLSEGWDVKHLPAMANALRNGSYSRGFLTALGGVEAKGNYRIFQNTVVSEEDCGTKLGLRITLDKDMLDHFVSYSVIEKDGSLTEITEENKKDYLDQPVVVRSLAYCETKGQNVCAVCAGKKIASTPNAISTYASDLGSLFVGMLLAQMHGVALKTAKIDYRASLR